MLRTDARTHGRTDGWTDGQRENSIPPTNKVCGGYNKKCYLNNLRGVFIPKTPRIHIYLFVVMGGKDINIKLCVRLTHLPTTHFQPMIQDSNQECDFIWAPFNTVHLLIHTPSSIITLGPIVTLGPILQFFPILALGSWKNKPNNTR